jgi:hypothetical protein
MTAIDNTPANKNFLSPLNFVFRIKRSPHLNFFVQRVGIPALSLQNPLQTNPFVSIPIAGDHLHFENLDVTFKVDEDLQNWFEMHNWLRSLGFPENFSEYAQIKNQSIASGASIRSDISLIILNAVKLPIYECTFIEAFPQSLSDLTFDTTDTSVNYITATVSFKYLLYTVEKL